MIKVGLLGLLSYAALAQQGRSLEVTQEGDHAFSVTWECKVTGDGSTTEVLIIETRSTLEAVVSVNDLLLEAPPLDQLSRFLLWKWSRCIILGVVALACVAFLVWSPWRS